MVYYIINPISQPELLFANCTVNTVDESSRNIIDHREDVIELSYFENFSGHMILETEYGPHSLTEGLITLLMPDCRYVAHPSAACDKIAISCVAVRISQMEYERCDETDVQKIYKLMQEKPSSLFIPQTFLELPSGTTEIKETIKVLQIKIRFLINSFKNINLRGKYVCISQWYDLCAEIDRSFRNVIGSLARSYDEAETKKVSSAYYYVHKAQKYITLHVGEKINPTEVSAYIGVSHAYFVKLFKKEMGISLNNYIYQMRIYNFCERLDRQDEISGKVLAAECGFQDFRHVQRLFQKYIGMSIQEYRKQSKGLTLYHTNPWQFKNLDEDLLKKDNL